MDGLGGGHLYLWWEGLEGEWRQRTRVLEAVFHLEGLREEDRSGMVRSAVDVNRRSRWLPGGNSRDLLAAGGDVVIASTLIIDASNSTESIRQMKGRKPW